MAQDRMIAGDDKARTIDQYQAPNIDATLARTNSVMSKVRVVHGANEKYFDNLTGKTVGSVRKSLREVFNIPGDASALISGKEVGDDFVLEGGMNLEFVKEAGVKGGENPRRLMNDLMMFVIYLMVFAFTLFGIIGLGQHCYK